jgi:rubrerythrin
MPETKPHKEIESIEKSITSLVENIQKEILAIAGDLQAFKEVQRFLYSETQDDAYTNYYACQECGVAWSTRWACTCDDKCPKCNTAHTPYSSYKIL